MTTISPQSFDTVWFDLDDTIFDFTENSRAAMALLYDQSILRRHFPTLDDWIRRYKPINDSLWTQYSQGRVTTGFLRTQRFLLPLLEEGLPLDEANDAAPKLDQKYLHILSLQKKLIPGAREILTKIKKAGIKTGILSNGFNDIQQRKLSSTGIDRLIDYVVLSENVRVAKPHNGIYRYAMNIAGSTEPKRNLMIGDNPLTDIEGAIRAGWKAILFDRHHLLSPPEGAEKITDFSQITVENRF